MELETQPDDTAISDTRNADAHATAEARRYFELLSLPYYLVRLESGRYALINRQHKPVGNPTREWAKHEEAPSFALAITEAVAAQLSWCGDKSLSRVYLSDGRIGGPDYERRLALLVGLIRDADNG